MRLNKYCHATDCRYFIDLKESTGHEICGEARGEFFGGCHDCPLYETRSEKKAENPVSEKRNATITSEKCDMTPERAKEKLKELVDEYESEAPFSVEEYKEHREIVKIANEAIERMMIAKKPERDPSGDVICPTCGGVLIYTFHRCDGGRCDSCGQLIDWSGH